MLPNNPESLKKVRRKKKKMLESNEDGNRTIQAMRIQQKSFRGKP